MAIEFKDGKYVDPQTGRVTLDPTVYKDWQIAEEAEKNLPSVDYFREKLGLLPEEIIPYGKTPKIEAIRAGLDCGVHIRLHKRIPVCAGLGGGSSDAAAVLRALERLTGAGFTRAELEEMGAQVGSDVPHCGAGGTMLAEGRGEKLTVLKPAPRFFVAVCKPDFPISTPALFARVDGVTITARPDTDAMLAAIEHGDADTLCANVRNIFEQALDGEQRERIETIKCDLLAYGAKTSAMTGSGSVVFGLFSDKAACRRACEALQGECGKTFCAEFV